MRGKRLVQFLLLVALVSLASGQQNNAELSGVVTDQSGGVLPNAKITAVQVATNTQRATHANGAGFYTVSQLPPGSYKLAAAQPGFETEVREDVQLTVGQQAKLDVAMRVGQVTTEAVVSSGLSEVETQSSSLSSVMDRRSDRNV